MEDGERMLGEGWAVAYEQLQQPVIHLAPSRLADASSLLE